MRKRNYKKEYADFHGKPKQIKNRASRNAARTKVVKAVGKTKARGKDVHHKDGNPGNNIKSNLALTTKKYNRAKNK